MRKLMGMLPNLLGSPNMIWMALNLLLEPYHGHGTLDISLYEVCARLVLGKARDGQDQPGCCQGRPGPDQGRPGVPQVHLLGHGDGLED